ncbi:protein-lysine N-methyltransferase [Saccharomycopsis crataegensis]|uniref:Protein-lysine N-methyltransferase EFM5 n=1 Tax=Saccharomycopsis crataegensis TaxID=43959 RepID=A0AAV5QRN8_9ASCO|nr:protein-lysine N-methyltransferase [Saccharomycopsis crataegensis]
MNIIDMDSDDELSLPADTLAALAEFRQEESARLEKFRQLESSAEEQFQETQQKDIELFKEDWQLSQFWYNQHTATLLAQELLDGADQDTMIAIISAPSVYAAMTKLPSSSFHNGVTLKDNVWLFEYDSRFSVLAGDKFVLYDFNHPLKNLPSVLLKKTHRVLIDPPFLSEDCQTKAAITVRALLVEDKSQKTEDGTLRYRVSSCTGERMATLIEKVYPGVKMTTFYPEHERGLSNEFRCYASYEGSSWKFQ